ncbi:MAG: hypothetical protein K5770_14035 [Lachnospiraceae bacterium]|nr:hypothetical protein [Lachnospiraceae bacterium]
MKNELITLIVETNRSNDRGFTETVEKRFEGVFAKISDVKFTEFYAAASANIRVSLIATVNTEDMANSYVEQDSKKVYPSMVEYEGIKYEIIRRYRRDEVTTDLSLKEVE